MVSSVTMCLFMTKQHLSPCQLLSSSSFLLLAFYVISPPWVTLSCFFPLSTGCEFALLPGIGFPTPPFWGAAGTVLPKALLSLHLWVTLLPHLHPYILVELPGWVGSAELSALYRMKLGREAVEEHLSGFVLPGWIARDRVPTLGGKTFLTIISITVPFTECVFKDSLQSDNRARGWRHVWWSVPIPVLVLLRN